MRNHKKFTGKQKLKILTDWKEHNYREWYVDILVKKYQCCRASLYKWRSQNRWTAESLENTKPIPKTPHPNQMTKAECMRIEQLLADNPTFGYLELFSLARQEFAYSRHPMTFYKYIRKHCQKPVSVYNKYIAKPYDTQTMIGQKMQMDVKVVPIACYKGKVQFWYTGKFKKKQHSLKFYQYSLIDECSRECFVYAYDRHNATSTKDFLTRAIVYFGYIPDIIQTDNGKEFTNKLARWDTDKEHDADKVMNYFGITHKLIEPATPRHNGKVERFHRTSQEHFYNHLSFETLDELQTKLGTWLDRHNNTVSSVLLDRHGKQKWQTPIEKRLELLELLKEQSQSESNQIEITARHKDGKLTTQFVTLPKVRWLTI